MIFCKYQPKKEVFDEEVYSKDFATDGKVFALTVMMPGFALAQTPATAKNMQEMHLKLNKAKVDLLKLKNSGADPKMVNDLMNALGKLDTDVNRASANGVADRFTTETIYDLDSIPTRVALFVKCLEAMSFGTTTLKDKVADAHRELAGGITLGILKTVNPFESIARLEAYSKTLDELMQKIGKISKCRT